MNSLSDIELLALNCWSDESKGYIEEAIRCYNAGAYRASIVTTWIAVVFDLIDKIRALSLSGDQIAKQLENDYEKYISQIENGNLQGFRGALEYERNIIDSCNKQLRFFNPQEIVDLKRLQEDRHRCAHPSYKKSGIPFYPSAEQARLHIRNAVIFVLTQSPVQGKAALESLMLMVESDFFPSDKDKAIAHLKNTEFKKASSSLINGFVDTLLFRFLNKNDRLNYKPRVPCLINAAHEIYPGIVEERLNKQLNKIIKSVSDEDFEGVAYLVYLIDFGWELLDSLSRDKVILYVETGAYDDVVRALSSLFEIDDLKESVRRRIAEFDLAELDKAINEYAIGELGKKRAFELLSDSGSWQRTNAIFLRTIFPLFDSLSKSEIISVIEMPTKTSADLIGSKGYYDFIVMVRQRHIFEKAELEDYLRSNRANYLIDDE